MYLTLLRKMFVPASISPLTKDVRSRMELPPLQKGGGGDFTNYFSACFLLHHWSRFTESRTRNDAASITDAMAVAPA